MDLDKIWPSGMHATPHVFLAVGAVASSGGELATQAGPS